MLGICRNIDVSALALYGVTVGVNQKTLLRQRKASVTGVSGLCLAVSGDNLNREKAFARKSAVVCATGLPDRTLSVIGEGLSDLHAE